MGLNQFKMTFKTTAERKYVSQDYQKSRGVKSFMWYYFQMGSRPHCPAQPCFPWNLYFTAQGNQTQIVNIKMIIKVFLIMITIYEQVNMCQALSQALFTHSPIYYSDKITLFLSNSRGSEVEVREGNGLLSQQVEQIQTHPEPVDS